MKAKSLDETLSFGFEQTFTTPDWWSDPGFVATSNTPLKLEKMKALADALSRVTGGESRQSQDVYGHLQYESFLPDGSPSFVVTMDPGSIEVKTPPLLIGNMEQAMAPLFEAAELASVVPYRNWWYGIRTGTEGGCHVNMAGFTPETNPLKSDPSLVVKYAAFFHNNPWLHYPFMGVDVGPGGNCMRMDEHVLDPHSKHAPGSMDSMERFAAVAARINSGERLSAQEVSDHFKGSKLAEDKHSAPSLYKYKAPLFFIEERAVEALRAPEEFTQVAGVRLSILKALQKSGKVETLKDFGPELHRELLCSTRLWEGFVGMAGGLGLNPEPYRRYFDRQFPRLSGGEMVPKLLEVREGRRPRVVTGIQMRGELIISKTIDTSYARLELIWTADAECMINGQIYPHAQLSRDGSLVRCLLLDLKKSDQPLDLALISHSKGETLEKARFHTKDMMFKVPDFEIGPSSQPVSGGKRFYFNIER